MAFKKVLAIALCAGLILANATFVSAQMSLREARAYLVELINRDRAGAGLQPVALDIAASQSSQLHTEDMVTFGFHGHWDLNGTKPDLRYTEAGGTDFAAENASFFFEQLGLPAALIPDAVWTPGEVEEAETGFMNSPGHRANILRPEHNKVGLGLSKGQGPNLVHRAVVQQFVNDYGEMDLIPLQAPVGQVIRVSGAFNPPYTIRSVSVGREELPRSMTIDEVNAMGAYSAPQPYVNYWPPRFVTPIPIQVQGNSFSIEFPLDDAGQEGLYYITIRANGPSGESILASQRTVRVLSNLTPGSPIASVTPKRITLPDPTTLSIYALFPDGVRSVSSVRGDFAGIDVTQTLLGFVSRVGQKDAAIQVPISLAPGTAGRFAFQFTASGQTAQDSSDVALAAP